MNLLKLFKVIKKLKEYHLTNETSNILEWLICLNNKQIDNLLKLDVEPNEFLEKKNILDLSLLNSEYYIYDITLINNCHNKMIADYLGIVATNTASLQNPYHEQDMKWIANAKTEKYAEYLKFLATNTDSLQSPHHEKDMKLIANAKTEQYAFQLFRATISTASLQSPYHEQDMEWITNAKTEKYAEYLSRVLDYDCYSLQSPYHENHHELDMKLIAEATTELKASLLSCLASSLESLQSPHHREDMEFFANFDEAEYKDKEYILSYLCNLACGANAFKYDYYRDDFNLVKSATSEWKAQCLGTWVGDDIFSLENPYHEEDMQLIANAKSDAIAIALKDVACSENSLKSKYHRETMQFIANAQSDAIAQCIGIFACLIPAFPEEYYKEYINTASQIKIDNVARTLGAIVRDFSLFTNSGYDRNSFKLIVKADSEVVSEHLLDILYSFRSSLTHKERFKEALMVAYRNNFNLEDINYLEVQNETISIMPRLSK